MLPLLTRSPRPQLVCGRSEGAIFALLEALHEAQAAAAPADWPLDGAEGAALTKREGGFFLSSPQPARPLTRLRRAAPWLLEPVTHLRDVPPAQPVLALLLPARGEDPADRAFLSACLDALASQPGAFPHIIVALTDALPFLPLSPVPFDPLDAWTRARAGLWDGETPWQKAARPEAWQGALTAMNRSWGGRLEGVGQRLAGAARVDLLPLCARGFDRATGIAAAPGTPAQRLAPFNLQAMLRLMSGQARFAQAMLPA